MRIIYKFLVVFILGLFFMSCAPSYPKEYLIDKTQELISKETEKDVKVFLKDTTLFIYVDVEGINTDMTASNDVFNMIQKVLMLSTRVSLSTDAKIDFFYVIIASEKNGILIIFKQYVDDVKKWFYGNIGRDDFFKRSLLETKVSKGGYVFDESHYSAMTMPDFISDQTVYRFRAILLEEIGKLNKQLQKISSKNQKESTASEETIEPENTDDEKKIELENEIKRKRGWSIILENTLHSKKYVDFNGNGHYFQYVFNDFDKDNLLNIEYEEFYKALVDVHKQVTDIYKFKEYFAVYVNKDNNKVFEYEIK